MALGSLSRVGSPRRGMQRAQVNGTKLPDSATHMLWSCELGLLKGCLGKEQWKTRKGAKDYCSGDTGLHY
jgi:hypothetical protein